MKLTSKVGIGDDSPSPEISHVFLLFSGHQPELPHLILPISVIGRCGESLAVVVSKPGSGGPWTVVIVLRREITVLEAPVVVMGAMQKSSLLSRVWIDLRGYSL